MTIEVVSVELQSYDGKPRLVLGEALEINGVEYIVIQLTDNRRATLVENTGPRLMRKRPLKRKRT